jgi:hypothetical protein
MKQANTVTVKNAKKLRAFNQEDKDFFAEFSAKSIGEKIMDLQGAYVTLDHLLDLIFQENSDSNNVLQVSAAARAARFMLRDIKHYELALTKHLEQIEVTGEWK